MTMHLIGTVASDPLGLAFAFGAALIFGVGMYIVERRGRRS